MLLDLGSVIGSGVWTLVIMTTNGPQHCFVWLGDESPALLMSCVARLAFACLFLLSPAEDSIDFPGQDIVVIQGVKE